MIEAPRRALIQIKLTERQKDQIRKATGRRVNSLELRLQSLPEPSAPPEAVVSQTGSPTTG
jgi:hypothetical protein